MTSAKKNNFPKISKSFMQIGIFPVSPTYLAPPGDVGRKNTSHQNKSHKKKIIFKFITRPFDEATETKLMSSYLQIMVKQ